MKPRIFITLLVLMAILGGIFFWQSQGKPQPAVKKASTPLPKEVTVTLDKDGFSPNEVTIKQGTAVRWKNTSGDKQTVNSDDYPTNQKHKELNFGIFNDGSTVVYTFTKPGTYGYHNHLNPKQKGKIIVEK